MSLIDKEIENVLEFYVSTARSLNLATLWLTTLRGIGLE